MFMVILQVKIKSNKLTGQKANCNIFCKFAHLENQVIRSKSA